MSPHQSTVLVTGAAGFIGTQLVQALHHAERRVVALVREHDGRAHALEQLAGVSLMLASEESWWRSAPPDGLGTVFHLAATGVNPSQRGLSALLDGNVVLTERVLQWVAPARPQFFYIGSCSEYGDVAEPELLSEEHTVAPRTLYGASKASGFLFARALAGPLAVPVFNLRLFGTYGPGEHRQRLIPHIVAELLAGEKPALTPGTQKRDFTHVHDVVRALMAAEQSSALEPYAAYNICTGVPTSVADLARTVARELGVGEDALGLGELPPRPDESQWIVGDPSRFRTATGYSHSMSVAEGVRHFVNHLRSLRDG